MEKIIKQRHPVTTIFLVVLMIAFASVSVYLISMSNYAIWGFATEDNAKKFFYIQHDMVDLFINGVIAMGILYAINAIGALLILLWKKSGYWLVLGASVISLLIDIVLLCYGGSTSDGIVFCALGILAPVVLWAILQIKSKSQSRWNLLRNKQL